MGVGVLAPGEAFLLRGVVVGVERIAEREPRFDEGLVQRVAVATRRGLQGPVAAAKGIPAAVPPLRPLEAR